MYKSFFVYLVFTLSSTAKFYKARDAAVAKFNIANSAVLTILKKFNSELVN